ncbi:MAG: hypothetical protein ACLQCU_07355 [Acidimicrobiales bacterium]
MQGHLRKSEFTDLGLASAHTEPLGVLHLIGPYYGPITGQFLSIDPKVRLGGISEVKG